MGFIVPLCTGHIPPATAANSQQYCLHQGVILTPTCLCQEGTRRAPD